MSFSPRINGRSSQTELAIVALALERQQEIEQFWLETLERVYSEYSKKKRTNRLPYGTVRVCVHSTELVQSIYGAIQEYGGFERPEWLG